MLCGACVCKHTLKPVCLSPPPPSFLKWPHRGTPSPHGTTHTSCNKPKPKSTECECLVSRTPTPQLTVSNSGSTCCPPCDAATQRSTCASATRANEGMAALVCSSTTGWQHNSFNFFLTKVRRLRHAAAACLCATLLAQAACSVLVLHSLHSLSSQLYVTVEP